MPNPGPGWNAVYSSPGRICGEQTQPQNTGKCDSGVWEWTELETFLIQTHIRDCVLGVVWEKSRTEEDQTSKRWRGRSSRSTHTQKWLQKVPKLLRSKCHLLFFPECTVTSCCLVVQIRLVSYWFCVMLLILRSWAIKLVIWIPSEPIVASPARQLDLNSKRSILKRSQLNPFQPNWV